MTLKTDLTFRDPVCRASLDWPAGNSRVVANFAVVSHRDRGEWVMRQTTGKQRISPCAARVRIVTGSDERTYIVGKRSGGRRFVMSGTMRKLIWLNYVKDRQLCNAIDKVLNDDR